MQIYRVLDFKTTRPRPMKPENYWPEPSSSADDAAEEDTSIKRDDAGRGVSESLYHAGNV